MPANTAPTFSVGGMVATGFAGAFSSYAKSVITQSDGKIILVGYNYGTGPNQFELVRYNIDGSLDTSFGEGGKVTTPNIGAYGDFINDAVLQSDGKIVIVGRAHAGGLDTSGQPTEDFIILRYKSDGSLDTSFGGDGIVTTDFGLSEDDNASSISIQADGKILVVGVTQSPASSDFALARYNQDGTLDTSFGLNGKVITDVNQKSEFASSAIIQPDGKIVVTGSIFTDGLFENFVLVRYNSNGSLDDSFGVGGKATTNMILNATDVAMQSDGKFIVGGTGFGDSIDFGLTRYNANGTIDTSFGQNGKVTTDFKNLNEDWGYDLAIQPDGKIVLVGRSLGDFSIFRYNVDGSLDLSFGTNGKTAIDIGSNSFDTAYSVTFQADGKILVAGDSQNSTGVKFALARINSDGTPDASFNSLDTSTSLNNPLFYYFKDAPPIALDSNVQIYDAQLAASNNYNGSSITLARQGGQNSQDVFSALGNLSFSGNNAVLSGLTIGTVSNSNGLLKITFNDNATQIRINEVISSFAYSNNAEIQPTQVIINWTFNDGNTGAQGNGGSLSTLGSTKLGIFSIVNEAPVLTGTKTTLASGLQGIAYTVSSADLLTGFTDAEGSSLSVENLTSSHGSVIKNANGTFTITPDVSYRGIVNLNYYVSDGSRLSLSNQSFTLNSPYDSLLTNEIAIYSSIANLSPSAAMNSLVTSFSNLENLDVISFNSLNANSVSGTLTNGDFFSVLGTNLLDYPSTITRLDYNSINNIQLSTIGSVSQASEFSDVTGSLSRIVFTDNNFGAGQQVVYTFNGSFDVTGFGVDTINNIEIKKGSNSIYIAGNLFSNDASPSGISGTITSAILKLGSYTENLTNISLDYNLFDSYTSLTQFLENALIGNNVLVGTSLNDIKLGFNGNDSLSGLAGNDTLDGGLGADTMLGGDGQDVYFVDNVGDVVTETNTSIALSENDRVQSTISYTLSANVEQLTLLGTASINGTGNALANTIAGNSAANVLSGGLGADTMIGNAGDDTYIVDNLNDSVIENLNEGNDTVVVAYNNQNTSPILITSYNNIENITVSGTGLYNITGDFGSNIIIGNESNNVIDGEGFQQIVSTGANDSLYGEGGNDTLFDLFGDNYFDGGTGADTMSGGNGSDTYIVDNLGDVIYDIESYSINKIYSSVSLNSVIYNADVYLTGTNNINVSGYSNFNSYGYIKITGNSGDNIFFGAQNSYGIRVYHEQLIGGKGNDTYYIDQGDVITEIDGEGIDTVVTGVFGYVLGNNLENLICSYQGVGNSLDNSITGSIYSDNLKGMEGNDTLIGGAGSDTLEGGFGLDFVNYASSISAVNVNLLLNRANDGNNGVDSLNDIENAIGSNFNDIAIGNNSSNNLQGLNGNDTLDGGAGNDTLDGGAGNDTMTGGDGQDVYFLDNVGDVITETNTSSAFSEIDRVESTISYTLGANLEQLTLLGTASINGTGNALANLITGNAGNNVIIGGAGVDTMTGGLGDDTYEVTEVNDVIIESSGAGSGNDTVWIGVSGYTLANHVENLNFGGSTEAFSARGNALNNVINGNAGNNQIEGLDGNDIIIGRAGVDTMTGGLGDDTYEVTEVNDVIIESSGAGSGNDTVWIGVSGYTLAIHVENLNFGGSTEAYFARGNALANLITGNAGNNVIIGGAGVDTMTGGLGDDTYEVTEVNDVIIESSGAGSGNDTVWIGVSGYTLANHVENLNFGGSTEAYFARGNALANLITGNAGNNVIIGGAGVDTMSGGLGNDVYEVTEVNDVIIESSGAGSGNDTVWIGVSGYTLANHVENLNFGGSTEAYFARGNALANLITGNAGNNVIIGGAGVDTMTGGLGDDTYEVTEINDVIIEASGAGSGNDTVWIGVSGYTLANNVENLNFGGSTEAFSARGNALNNVINGNAGNNQIEGLDGNDIIIGGIGVDTLIGGLGADTFDFNAIIESLGGANRDVITDFSVAQGDRIDLSTIDANTSVANDQAFLASILASGDFNAIGQLRLVGNVLSGNTDSNFLTSEFEIQLTGLSALNSSSFIL